MICSSRYILRTKLDRSTGIAAHTVASPGAAVARVVCRDEQAIALRAQALDSKGPWVSTRWGHYNFHVTHYHRHCCCFCCHHCRCHGESVLVVRWTKCSFESSSAFFFFFFLLFPCFWIWYFKVARCWPARLQLLGS